MGHDGKKVVSTTNLVFGKRFVPRVDQSRVIPYFALRQLFRRHCCGGKTQPNDAKSRGREVGVGDVKGSEVYRGTLPRLFGGRDYRRKKVQVH